MRSCLAVCLICCTTSVVLAQDTGKSNASVIARKYVAFWKPFAGTWEMRLGGESPVTMIWHGEETDSGMYYTSRSVMNGRVIEHGLHGYDPAHKCWKVVVFGVESDSRPFSQRTGRIFVDAPTLGTVRAGITGRSEDELSKSDGTVVKTKGKMVMKIVERDRIEYVITDRISNGEKQPDQSIVMTRKN